jgi:hypothetical protein
LFSKNLSRSSNARRSPDERPCILPTPHSHTLNVDILVSFRFHISMLRNRRQPLIFPTPYIHASKAKVPLRSVVNRSAIPIHPHIYLTPFPCQVSTLSLLLFKSCSSQCPSEFFDSERRVAYTIALFLGGRLLKVETVRSYVVHKPFAFGFAICGFVLRCPRP